MNVQSASRTNYLGVEQKILVQSDSNKMILLFPVMSRSEKN